MSPLHKDEWTTQKHNACGPIYFISTLCLKKIYPLLVFAITCLILNRFR